MTLKKIESVIYTDGSARGNPGGPGGFSAILLSGDQKRIVQGFEPNTTNNRMELRGAIAGLIALEERSTVTVVTDSEYVYKGITTWIKDWKSNGWKNSHGKKVYNMDLWRTLYYLSYQFHNVSWEWTKGHAGNKYNEEADQLATEALEEGLKVEQACLSDKKNTTD